MALRTASELADCIEQGRREHPDWVQWRGSLYDPGPIPDGDTTAACALGFAYADGLDYDDTTNLPSVCPAGHGSAVYYSMFRPLGSVIPHLNDKHEWSLDQIVTWLRSVDEKEAVNA